MPLPAAGERLPCDWICTADQGSWERQAERTALGAFAQQVGNGLMHQLSPLEQINYVFNSGEERWVISKQKTNCASLKRNPNLEPFLIFIGYLQIRGRITWNLLPVIEKRFLRTQTDLDPFFFVLGCSSLNMSISGKLLNFTWLSRDLSSNPSNQNILWEDIITKTCLEREGWFRARVFRDALLGGEWPGPLPFPHLPYSSWAILSPSIRDIILLLQEFWGKSASSHWFTRCEGTQRQGMAWLAQLLYCQQPAQRLGAHQGCDHLWMKKWMGGRMEGWMEGGREAKMRSTSGQRAPTVIKLWNISHIWITD